MSALGFLLVCGVMFVAGWFCCSYYEQEARKNKPE